MTYRSLFGFETISKYLEIIIDNITWSEHINYIYNKILKFTSISYKIHHILPVKVLLTIYFAFVHSHLLYGIEIYASMGIPTVLT